MRFFTNPFSFHLICLFLCGVPGLSGCSIGHQPPSPDHNHMSHQRVQQPLMQRAVSSISTAGKKPESATKSLQDPFRSDTPNQSRGASNSDASRQGRNSSRGNASNQGRPNKRASRPKPPASCHALGGSSASSWEFVCQTRAAYEVCRERVRQGVYFFCAHAGDRESGVRYAPKATMDADLSQHNCAFSPDVSDIYFCQDQSGYERCMTYLRGHRISGCYLQQNGTLLKSHWAPQAELAQKLKGCQRDSSYNPLRVWSCKDNDVVQKKNLWRCHTYRRGDAVDACLQKLNGSFQINASLKSDVAPATGSSVSMSGAVATTVTRYQFAKVSGSTPASITISMPTPAAPAANPLCEVACGKGCTPVCKRVQFVSEAVAPDGLWAIWLESGNQSCNIPLHFQVQQLLDSEKQLAYLACQQAAWSKNKTTWNHTASITAIRKLSMLFEFTDPLNKVTQNGCSSVDKAQFLQRYVVVSVAVQIQCVEGK